MISSPSSRTSACTASPSRRRTCSRILLKRWRFSFVVIQIRLVVPRLEADAAGRRLGRARNHRLLEQQVHEHVHRLGLDDQGARRLVRAGVEVLVNAVVVHDRHVARLPVVAHPVMYFVALAVEDVERRLVDVAVLLRSAARGVLLEVKMEHLRDAVLRLDIVPAVGLRAVDEPELLPLPHARHGAQPRELLAQAVLALKGAHEDAVLLAVIVRFGAHAVLRDYHSLSPFSTLRSISCWNSGGPKPKRS